MPSGLPLVGVEATILNVAGFLAGSKAFNTALNGMVRSAQNAAKAIASGDSSEAAARNSRIVERAQLSLQRVQAQTAAATKRAQDQIIKTENQAATAVKRATQDKVNARTRAKQSAASAAAVEQNAATSIQQAQDRQANAARRLTISQELLSKAYTPARAAQAAKAQVSLDAATQRTATTTQRTAAAIVKAEADKTAAAGRATAATRTANAVQTQGAAAVSAAQTNAANVATVGAARVASAQQAVTSAEAASVTSAGTMATIVGGAFAAIALAATVAGVSIVTNSAAYQHELNAVGAIANESRASMMDLSAAQLDMSRNSTQSATQLTTFSGELVKAGFSVEQVTQKALGVGNAMIIASNGELEAARAATLLQVAFAGFGSVAAQTVPQNEKINTQLAVMAQTANSATAAVQNSTLTFSGFADAMRQGGGVAARMGYSIQEFSAAVGVMGLTIQSGTEIGTGLRMMFQNLQAPSVKAAAVMKQYGISLYDASGATRPLRDVIVGLNTAFSDSAIAAGKVTEAQRDQALATLFGGRSIKTVSALLNAGVDDYDRLFTATSNTTTAQDAANRVMDSSVSTWQMLLNTFNAITLAIGEGIEPLVNSLVKSLKALVDQFGPTNDEARTLGETIGGFLFNALSACGEMWAFTITMTQAFIEIILATNQVVLDFQAIVQGMVASAGQSLGGLFDFAGQIFQGLVNFVIATANAFGEGFAAIVQTIGSAASAIGSAAQGIAQALSAGIVEASGNAAEALGTNVNGMGEAFNAFLQGISGIPASFASAVGQLGGIAARAFAAVVNKVNEFLNALAGLPLIGELIGGARAAFSGVSTAVGAAGVAISKFATTSVNAIKKIQLPNFRDYAGEVLGAFKAARAAERDISANRPAMPGEPAGAGTAPGSYPGGGGGGKPKKEPKGPADQAAKDLAQAMEKAAELLRDFFDDIENASRDTAKSISDAFNKAQDDIATAMAEAERDVKDAVAKAQEEINQIDTEKAIEKDAKARRDALDKELDYASRARDQALAEDEVRHGRELEDLGSVEDAKRKLRETTFDKAQEVAARFREEQRAEEDRAFEKSQEREQKLLDARQQLQEKALSKMQQLQEDALQTQQQALENALEKDQQARQDALDANQQARKDALDAQIEAEKNALEASQKVRESALKAELDAEKRQHDYQKALTEITKQGADDRAKAEEEYQKEISIGVKGSIARARRQEKLDAIKATEDEAKANLDTKQAEDDAELTFEQQQQKRLDDLQAQFDVENAAREAAANEAKRQQEITFQNEVLALRTQIEAETLAMRTQFAAQETAMREQHEKEQDDQHAQHERERDQLSESLENARLSRQKQRATEDRAFSEAQEAAKQKFIEEENKKQLAATRAAEDVERARKLVLEAQAIAQREADEQKRADLTEQLDQEEYDRRLIHINEERDKRIEAIHQTLADQQESITKQLAQEITDLEAQLAEKIKTIKEQYTDRMEDLMREGGEAMKPIIDNIGEQMETAFDGARSSVQELIAALQEALQKAQAAADAIRNMPKPPSNTGGGGGGGATIRPGGKPGETQSEVDNFNKNMAGKQYGGVVPGPYGKATMILAHGGEYFEGIGASGVKMTAVRAAESMAQRGIGSGGSVTNNYSYNVNANYGRTQTAGSVRMDLSALVAMTSR